MDSHTKGHVSFVIKSIKGLEFVPTNSPNNPNKWKAHMAISRKGDNNTRANLISFPSPSATSTPPRPGPLLYGPTDRAPPGHAGQHQSFDNTNHIDLIRHLCIQVDRPPEKQDLRRVIPDCIATHCTQ